ncbi:MAG TPA: hypothetical protein PKE45_06420 [Caldilineaceae bacterium]|nr:hypothetical protein [Caldilineaceae bacterium]
MSTEPNISYYDFRHPEATDLILVADRADGITTSDSFTINVPKEIHIYESTWSAAQYNISWDCCGRTIPGACNLNGEQLAPLSPPVEKWRLYLGELNEANFVQGKDHTIAVDGIGQRAYCGVSVVYSEAAQ